MRFIQMGFNGIIDVKGTIDLLAAAANENDKAEKNVTFKNNVSFRLGQYIDRQCRRS